jgi:hypothetical protein
MIRDNNNNDTTITTPTTTTTKTTSESNPVGEIHHHHHDQPPPPSNNDHDHHHSHLWNSIIVIYGIWPSCVSHIGSIIDQGWVTLYQIAITLLLSIPPIIIPTTSATNNNNNNIRLPFHYSFISMVLYIIIISCGVHENKNVLTTKTTTIVQNDP